MFSQSVIERLEYYVYFLQDPRNSDIFYIGKGEGNRVFAHVECAIKSTDTDNLKEEIIKDIIGSGHKVKHYILRHGLTEDEAFQLEAALIDFIGKDNLSNQQGGHDSRHDSSDFGIKTTDEISAMYDAEPLDTDIPIILININKLYHRKITDSELYESTRKSWKLGERKNKAKYAVAHYRGLTRAVYEIESWRPNKNRWEFIGKLAPDDIRFKLRYKSIKHLFKKGAANPIRYLNC